TVLIDITPTVSERIAVWPGDTPFRRRVNLSISGGANIDLSDIHTTVHLGAHTDAPNHYARDGGGIEGRPIELYYGPCQVVRVAVGRGERIRPEHITEPVSEERVLFATGSFPDPEEWNSDFAALSGELVDWLAERGVRLVGIDTPSIDLQEDKVLESHQRVAAHDMGILEGIVLEGVSPGRYTLVALPLKLEGADASPVRAVLVQGPA
ncbi:MAG: cyclase family protein, partial [Myxococcota bacterium]|nr:cyclase family protein [Myxococcota bacterium]